MNHARWRSMIDLVAVVAFGLLVVALLVGAAYLGMYSVRWWYLSHVSAWVS